MIAAIDIGSNSVRLLVTTPDGTEVERAVTVTGLARGVDATGRLGETSIRATTACLVDFAGRMDRHGVTTAAAVATSASRDAANGAEVMAAITDVLGFAPTIIDGEREAGLAFRGAAGGRQGHATVIDIGGGSTEISTGRDGQPASVASYDIGSVRITDRHLPDAPPTPVQVDAARRDAAAHFADVATGDPSAIGDQAARVLGVAGTFTSLSAMAQGLYAYDRTRVHASVLTADDLARLETRLSALTVDEIAAIPSLDPARAPVILGGTIVARSVLAAVGATAITVSEHDLLDGLAAELRSA